MASDAAFRAMDSANPCCLLWKTKYSKMEEKRNALRQGVEILKGQIDRLQQDNLSLKKACDEEQARTNVIQEEKQKEASLRISMEKEIAALKSEISSARYDAVSGNEDLNKEVTLLQACISERQVEIDQLKELLAEERKRFNAAKERADSENKKAAELQIALEHEKIRADEARKMADTMEKEIAALKSETQSSAPEVISGIEDLNKEVTLLRACISERELEIEQLKQLLTEEERKADAERQHADLERIKTVELHEALANEKSRADEASMVADAVGKKLEEISVQLETSKNEVGEARLKHEEAKKKLEAERQKAEKEKKRADEERARATEHRRIAEANEKQVVEEKSRASNLLMQLADKQRAVEKLQKELQDIMLSQRSAYSSELDEVKRNLETEKTKYAREKKLAEYEKCKWEEQKKIAEASTKKSIEEKHRADKLSQDLQGSRLRVEYLEQQLHEVNNLLEAERKKTSHEAKRIDAEKLKLDELQRIAVENRRMAEEEKFRADNLFQELENSRKKLQHMENELQQLKLCEKLGELSNLSPVVGTQTSELHFLQKQLAFEQERVKHFKEVAEFEKDRNIFLQEERVRFLKSMESILHQFGMSIDIGARHGANNGSKKSDLSDVHTELLFQRSLPSHIHLCGDAEFRMPSLSSRDASCQFKENEGFVPAVDHMQSPSGTETKLDLLSGGSRGETLRSSALNLNTASFSDEQLVGSQDRAACSLTTSAVLAQENANLQATTPKCSNECHEHKDGEKVGIVAENSVRSPVKATSDHALKRRKILNELESIKSMQSEGKRIFEEAEKKMYALQGRLAEPMVDQMDKGKAQLPVRMVNPFSNYGQSGRKRKASHEPEATCPHNDSVVQSEVDKHAVALTAYERPQNLQLLQDASGDILHCYEDVSNFEALMGGDYMKLLNLDNAVDEECFRSAIERPLSPTLPEIDLHDGEIMIDAQMLTMQASGSCEADDQHGVLIHDVDEVYCIVFSDMEENGSKNRIFCAVRKCAAQCCLFLGTNWLVHDILTALRLEKDLQPREKVCALFSLLLLNFSAISSRNLRDSQNKELLNSFCAHLRSVLCGVETRNLFAEICHIDDLLSLFEDFVFFRRFLLSRSNSGSLRGSGSNFEILHEGEKFVLSPSVASIDMVMAGSIVVASICAAIGHIDSLCEVSFNILRMCVTEDQMMLGILHIFVYACGQEYFSSSKHSSMEVVKSVITYVEHTFANIAVVDAQSGNNSKPCFVRCRRCPFSEGSLSLDDVSAMLIQELQSYCLGPCAPLFGNFGVIISSLELIVLKMGWNWACNNIVPKLLKGLESCDQRRIPSIALVALLGELGRLGIKKHGYDDVGVESIKGQLTDMLCHADSQKCNAFSMALASALVGLHLKVDKEYSKNNNDYADLPSENRGNSGSAIPGISGDCHSVLRNGQMS